MLAIGAGLWLLARFLLGKFADYLKQMDDRITALEKSLGQTVNVDACHQAHGKVLNAVEKLLAESRREFEHLRQDAKDDRKAFKDDLSVAHRRIDEIVKVKP